VSISVGIKGLQEAQRANVKAINALRPRGAFGQAIQVGTAMVHRYAVYHTPWDTRSLATSHRMQIDRGGLRGIISIDRGAINPVSGHHPFEYGYWLHEQGYRPGIRGGVRAFYQYTAERHGRQTLTRMGAVVLRGLP